MAAILRIARKMRPSLSSSVAHAKSVDNLLKLPIPFKRGCAVFDSDSPNTIFLERASSYATPGEAHDFLFSASSW